MYLWSVSGLLLLPILILKKTIDDKAGYLEPSMLFLLIGFMCVLFVLPLILQKTIKELTKASDRYENGQKTDFSKTLLSLTQSAKQARPYLNLYVIFALKHIFTLSLGWETITFLGGTLEIISTIFDVGVICENHLWDIDDVDPKDRESLFEPDTANDSA